MHKGYGVTVTHLGEPILTIDSTMLSGKESFSDADSEAIREAARHLLSFIGDGNHRCFVCGEIGGCRSDCEIGGD